MIIGSAIGSGVIDRMQERLETRSQGRVRRVSDTESTARLEADVSVGKRTVPVAVTVYKEHDRVRIQILTHDLTREEAEKLEDELALLLDLKVVERSDPESEAKVREAMDEHPAPAEPADREATDAEKTPAREPDRAPPTARP